MYKFTEDYLWWKEGQEIKEFPGVKQEDVEAWIKSGRIIDMSKPEPEEKSKTEKRIEDFTADLKDDGKRNYSNRKKSKSKRGKKK